MKRDLLANVFALLSLFHKAFCREIKGWSEKGIKRLCLNKK